MASSGVTTRLNRTYSSPSLSGCGAHHRGSQHNYGNIYDNPAFRCLQDEDDEFYVIGDRVFVDGHKAASVAYFGEVEFAPGDWVGVVMDHPLGNHNGKVHGREYFQCSPFHGLMVRPHRVSRIPGAESSRSSSRGGGRASTTPLPTLHQQRLHLAADSGAPGRRAVNQLHCGADGGRSPATSSVTTDSSYFYDDDYRPSTRLPSIAALGKRINDIEAGSSSSRPHSALGLSSPSTTTPSPVGILKKSPSYHQRLTPRAKSESRYPDRQESQREPDDPRVPVFNFRPRRAKLDQLQSRMELEAAGSSHSRILSDMSNRTTTDSDAATASAAADLRISAPPQVGDRVWVNSERGELSGLLRFMGETNFATGEWAGIELDRPWGKNDGSVLSYRYFYCPQDYGLFVPATRVRKHQSNSDWPGFKAMRSTVKSPPPPSKTTSSLYDSGSGTGSRSMTPSSYYSSSAASSGKDTPSTYETRAMGGYASSSPLYGGRESSLTSPADNPIINHFTPRIYDNSYKLEKPKFDDNDIEYQVRQSLQRDYQPLSRSHSSTTTTTASQLRPRSIKYTFSRSRYDGNPVARRTVEYD